MEIYQSMIDIWIDKVNRFVIKSNVERRVILSPHSSAESPLSFNFKSPIMFNNNKKSSKKEKAKSVKFNINNSDEEMEVTNELSEGMCLKINNLNKIVTKKLLLINRITIKS
jgi:hypothetical protein